MNNVTLTQQITIEPEDMNSRLKSTILDLLVQRSVGKCTAANGYTVRVEPEFKLLSNKINAFGVGIFTVQYTVVSLKPAPGMEMDGTVCMVFDGGLLLDVEERMKVLIPSENLKGYKFSADNSCFVKKSRKLSEGSVVTVKISRAEFRDGQFNCFGELVE